ncbi:growth hormone receptor-like [Myxocyprinus asiaticus]|uniref:growth hormone receptor-like n=1 Tax=Myxocyprinus asiaticus TaxID=70543 RepID=UPI00222212DA|nr:growth hormone receptor-like [Myxocyprinus asiaticus]XP_051536358.1 growth hormone receptor-like [Myxocyprinus asiaticus]
METVLFICILFINAVATQTVQGHTTTLPHLTGCFSRELITFHCQWEPGSLQNLTEPGDLRLFYMLEKDSKKSESKWTECPSYSSSRKNECYFDSSNTIIWYPYGIQLRSRSLDIVYDEMSFNVEDIVFPDPPVGLNWTLLSMGSSGLICDVVVSWEPPPSAAENVKTGWILLVYQTQYREKGSEQWNSLENGKETQAYIYGLRSNTEYEVRVRSKMRGYKFGDFSDSIFLLIPDKESRVPITAVLIFAAVGIGIILMFVVVSRQQKLMVIFLPPVPGPKIKGIDPMLLQKGQLSKFTSILGTHPGLRPELYSSDPWVEFIEVDIEEPHESQEELLIANSPVSDSPQMSSGFRDDDSGRASCCDPDLSDHDQTEIHHFSVSGHDGFHPLSHAHSSTPQPVAIVPQDTTWTNNLYSQVSDVTQRGEVMLSPEDQGMLCNTTCHNEALKDNENNKRKELQRLVVFPDERDYTSALVASVISAQHSQPITDYSTFTEQSQEQHSAFRELKNMSTETDTSPPSTAFPILAKPTSPEYTMVDGVDWKNSLLLKPNTQIAPQAKALLKTWPTPEGYLTPELLDNLN